MTARRAIKQIDSGPDPRGTLPPRFRVDDLVVDLGQAAVVRAGVRPSRWRCAGEVPLRPARR